MKLRSIMMVTVTGLTLASAAGGYAVGRTITVRPGDAAFFTPDSWTCSYPAKNIIRCQSGDAFPYVDLTSTRAGGVAVRVHTLRDPQGGRLLRTYDGRRYPIYVFTAF